MLIEDFNSAMETFKIDLEHDPLNDALLRGVKKVIAFTIIYVYVRINFFKLNVYLSFMQMCLQMRCQQEHYIDL